jgi:uncharacterized RDD family membrane protein YckC
MLFQMSDSEKQNNDEITYPPFNGRIAANFVDGVAIFLLMLLFAVITDEAVPLITTSRFLKSDLVLGILAVTTPILYFAITESSKLQATLGKYFTGIKVVDNKSLQRITFTKALFRAVIKITSVYAFGAGIIFFLLFSGEKNRTIHDAMTGTLVIDANS